MSNIISLDQQILDFLLDLEDISQDDLDREAKTADEYSGKYKTIKITVQNRLISMPLSESVGGKSNSEAKKTETTKIRAQKVFWGLKEWLPFWGQFKRIHNNDDVETKDTFHSILFRQLSQTQGPINLIVTLQ